MSALIGHISQIIGPVVDVQFTPSEDANTLPSINEALKVKRPDGRDLIIEVQHASHPSRAS